MELSEVNRRKRERLTIFLLAITFLILTWVEFRLFETSRNLPYVHSIFFFGLVNFNIILLLTMLFLIFRNIVKPFTEKLGGRLGSTLKSKLIAAFVGFSFVPTLLIFLVSVFYINNSFDKWFSEKISGVLKSSMEVTNAYYLTAKKKNYHFAVEVASQLREASSQESISRVLRSMRSKYSLDTVEYYYGVVEPRILAIANEDQVPEPPPVSTEFLNKGLKERVESSTIHQFEEGNLIRVVVPARTNISEGAVVVSSFVPLSLTSRMDDVAGAYEELRGLNPLEYPLKSIYLIILVLMTLLILLGATWFGVYLARQLAIPLEALGAATRHLAKREYIRVNETSGSQELHDLVQSFNSMTDALQRSELEVKESNQNLQQTLERLNERSRYIEVILSNVSTGVVSVDQNGIISMITRSAEDLLEIDAQKYIGRPVKEVLDQQFFSAFDDLLSTMKQHRARQIQKELRVDVNGRTLPLQITVSLLYDERQRDLGRIFVINDLTPVVSAQRAAAWSEVARRIAHEIKNPLTPIKLAAERLEKKFGESVHDPAFRECTRLIVEQVDDLKSLVNEFSQFAKIPQTQSQNGQLNGVIEQAVALFKAAHSNILFTISLDPQLPEIAFDADQMKRVVNNLLDNALAAVEAEAEPQIEVATQYDRMARLLRLSVSDNGSGIPKKMRDRVFEPYVTTKKTGTGLGLAIVKRTIEDHNGLIRAFSNRPKGTRMLIEIPVSEPRTNVLMSEEKESSQELGP